MDIEISRKFQKQLKACKDSGIRLKVLNIIEAAAASDTLQGIPGRKKLSGFKNCFRIRMGDYRIGIVVENDKVIFAAFDHRSDIINIFLSQNNPACRFYLLVSHLRSFLSSGITLFYQNFPL